MALVPHQPSPAPSSPLKPPSSLVQRTNPTPPRIFPSLPPPGLHLMHPTLLLLHTSLQPLHHCRRYELRPCPFTTSAHHNFLPLVDGVLQMSHTGSSTPWFEDSTCRLTRSARSEAADAKHTCLRLWGLGMCILHDAQMRILTLMCFFVFLDEGLSFSQTESGTGGWFTALWGTNMVEDFTLVVYGST